MGALFDAMMAAEAKRAKRKPSIVDAPEGAIVLFRLTEKTKQRRTMGWAQQSPLSVRIYLDLRTKRPNESFRGTTPEAAMGHRAAITKARSWTRAAVEQTVPKRARLRPVRVTFTRISTGKMDDDSLVACFKPCRDGVAEVLGFDDREFSIGGMRAGGIPIFYEQTSPKRKKAKGLLIDITWEARS